MDRINTDTKAEDLFGAGKHGFKDGDLPNAIVATRLEAEWFNNVQEELLKIVEITGIAPDAAARDQLYKAIRRLVGGSQRFTASGTFNVPEGITTVYLTGSGGGGGGSGRDGIGGYGGGGGGGADACVRVPVAVAALAAITVTIGAAGAGGGPNANGSAGGTTSFGALLSLPGGGGGITGSGLSDGGAAGGAGGAAGGAGAGSYVIGNGGGSIFGAVAGGGNKPSHSGGYGAGGCGGVLAGSLAGAGASGSAGFLVVEWGVLR